MKRFIEIKGQINFLEILSEWELILKITSKDIVPFILELQLLKYNHSKNLKIKSENDLFLNFNIDENIKQGKMNITENKYQIILSMNEIDFISSYLLLYYKNKVASVSHIHIEINNLDSGLIGDFTIIVADSEEPISGKKAVDILSKDN
jgi:hypothetical protein